MSDLSKRVDALEMQMHEKLDLDVGELLRDNGYERTLEILEAMGCTEEIDHLRAIEEIAKQRLADWERTMFRDG